MKSVMFWTVVFLVGYHEVSANKDALDFVTVYRLTNDIYVPKVTKEYYRQTNALGMLLKTKSRYIDSVEGMMPLRCSLATAECKWNVSEGWGFSNVTVEDDEDFSVKIEDVDFQQGKEGCKTSEEGWPGFCSTQNGRPTFSCPRGYVRNRGSCRHGRYSTDTVTTSTSIEYEGHAKTWLIIPPENSTLYLNITASGYDPNYGSHSIRVTAFSGVGMERPLHHFTYSTVQIKTKDVLEIIHENRGQTSMNIKFLAAHLTLQQDQGTLNYEIYPIDKFICVSVIHASPLNNRMVFLNANFVNGTNIEVPRVAQREFGNWKMDRFATPLDKVTNSAVRLVLKVDGKGTILHSIVGCSHFGNEDITVRSNVSFVPNITEPENPLEYTDALGNCYNGGKYNSEENHCICPAGFTGSRCEEGCGPNYFGNNCTMVCSDFASGCSRMIFCKRELPCLCAPGYSGINCSSSCDFGRYGPSCRQKCGHCVLGSCDRFTGLCGGGCLSGYYPPTCHITYTYPAHPPKILHQDLRVVTIETDVRERKGMGQPEFYQIQYKASDIADFWLKQDAKRLQSENITTKIVDLHPGTNYEVRVIFIDVDGNSYDGELIQTVQFSSLCIVSRSTEYNINAYSTPSTIHLDWKYPVNGTNCPVTGYTVELQRRWSQIEQNVTSDLKSIDFYNLLPGVFYEVRVRANTRFGEAPFSASFSVKTEDEAPFRVSNLQVKKNGNGKLLVAWKPPRLTGGHITGYTVSYKCMKVLACPHIVCDDPLGTIQVEANETYTELDGLQSHVQYYVNVAARSKGEGPYTLAYGLTQDAAPSAAPKMSPTPVVLSTNTSITIQWLPMEDCRKLNGYLVGYHYVLSAENLTVAEGNTDLTNFTFDDLIPQTTYFVHIYAVSTGGQNINNMLVINASTAGTVPEKVQNLDIYKKGRRVIGLRWAPPVRSYGEIKQFSVSYCQLNNCAAEVKVQVAPVSCVAWPDYFCYTIDNLMPNKHYIISVKAQNVNDNGFGNAATVTGITSEGVPEAPTALRIVSRTMESLTLQWKPPRMFNGALRSFLLNVEQTDSANASNCCAYIPLKELPVTSEKETYNYEVTDLLPASKYFVGISAKTMSIGPSSSLVISTSPEVPELDEPPQFINGNRVIVPAASNFPGLTSTYLLLVLVPGGSSYSQVWDSELAEKLVDAISGSFYIVQEYDPEDMVTPFEVEIGKGVGPRNGTIGVLEDPDLPPEFSVGLALVHDYFGAKNVGFAPAVIA